MPRGDTSSRERNTEAVREALEALVSCEDFRSSPRLSSFLRYIVEKSLAGESAELKEYRIGVEVFERPETFDPRHDTIVRVQATRLRRRLEKHYASGGSPGAIRISLPRGSYAPEFQVKTSERKGGKQDRSQLVWPAALAAAVVLAWMPYVLGDRSPETGTNLSRRFPVGVANLSVATHIAPAAAISPDSRHIVYVSDEEPSRLWLRALGSETPRPIPGTEGVTGGPFWSPDSRWIAYPAGDLLKKVGLDGVAPVALAEVGFDLHMRGGTWDPTGRRIVLGGGPVDDVLTLAVDGGPNEPLLKAPNSALTPANSMPHFLPTDAPATTLLVSVGTSARLDLHLLNVDADDVTKLADGCCGVYSPTGHIVYQAQAGGLWALPFSLESLEATGQPFPIAAGLVGPTISDDGTLVAIDGPATGRQQLVWRNELGEIVDLIGEPYHRISRWALSPDGKMVAADVQQHPADAGDIYLFSIASGVTRRLTSCEGRDTFPTWSPDGRHVVYRSDCGGERELWITSVEDASETRPLTHSTELGELGASWSPDSGNLLYSVRHGAELDMDLWTLALEDGKPASDPRPWLAGDSKACMPAISPNGRWAAYVSDETGRFELYIRDFPSGARPRRISRDGGYSPQWSRDGGSVVYSSSSGRLEIVRIDPDEGMAVGPARLLYPLTKTECYRGPNPVALDGRFIGVEDLRGGYSAPPQIHVLENWHGAQDADTN